MAEGIIPIIDQEGADPSILKQGDIYYYTKTTGNNVTLFREKSLMNIAAGESLVIYEPDSTLENLWAPEIQYLDETWYIYFAANTPSEEMHHMYVLKNENPDPFAGEWKCEPVKGMDDKFAIDGVVLETANTKYFIWSGWAGYENVQQNIYLAEMLSPMEVKEEKVLLSAPEYDWEKSGEPLVNEGPEILIQNQTINLVYSASGSWTDDYCLGLLTADISANLKDPASWIKEPAPILNSGNKVYGPGHNGFTVSPDGKESIIIYHSARWQGAGWNRQIRFGYLDFEESGKLKSMEPAAPEQLIHLPSGETPRIIYLADTFTTKGDIRLEESVGALSEKSAIGFLSTSDNISLKIRSEQPSEAILFVYARMEEYIDETDIAGLTIAINGMDYETKIYPGTDYQPIPIKVILAEGNNDITIHSEAGGSLLSVDRVEVSQ